MTKQTPDEFITSGKHLPPIIRDFHDAKDVFKTMHSSMDLGKFPKEIQSLGWINCHIFIIDVFLWWMAKRGYTLQKSRQKVGFLNLQEEIEFRRNEEKEQFRRFLNQRKDD
jgi:hypothetical protein